jgi:hypothetical protein
MTAVTTYQGKKPFSWSYSQLKGYADCAKRYYHTSVARDVVEEESEQLAYGNLVHKLLADAIGKGTPLPAAHAKDLQPWVDKFRGGAATILVEQKYAITEDFQPTDWRSRDAWYRGIGDVVKIAGPVALVADHKTGKILENSEQLALMAQCVFAHYPEVRKVRSEFIWLAHNATTREDFTREDMPGLWAGLLPRVKALRNARENNIFPPRPGGLCKRYCSVKQCPHWGE